MKHVPHVRAEPCSYCFQYQRTSQAYPSGFPSKTLGLYGRRLQQEKILPHETGGMDDHPHLLIQLPPTWSLSDAVQEIKTSSSRWMGKSFAWQRGFAALSVSALNKDAVGRYIRTQDAHHEKMDYKSELIALLKKHGVPYDPKYVFD